MSQTTNPKQQAQHPHTALPFLHFLLGLSLLHTSSHSIIPTPSRATLCGRFKARRIPGPTPPRIRLACLASGPPSKPSCIKQLHTPLARPSTMTAPTAGFLADRLAKASAVPAEQRSADVRAFIETCRLQAELLEELGLPESSSGDFHEWRDSCGRWTAALALKLVRSHFISPGSPLRHSPQLLDFAAYNVLMRTSFGRTGTLPHDLGHEATELLEGDPGLKTFAILAAGLPGLRKDRGWGRGGSLSMNT